MNLMRREKDKLMIALQRSSLERLACALCDLIRIGCSSLDLERAALETQTPGDACFLSSPEHRLAGVGA